MYFPRSNKRGLIEAKTAMPRKKPTSKRIYRDLTPDEQLLVNEAREEMKSRRDEIMAEGRLRKRALMLAREQVQVTIAKLKSRREKLGLTLTDVERRCGLKPSALSRLENDPEANPTLLTLQRYATAVGLRLVAGLEPDCT